MNIIKNIQKVVAFTLAETLVVMGIIGVVAALTIPNLNQSTGNRETVTKLKKVYANLEDAFGRATAVYGPVDEWFPGVGAITGSDELSLGGRFSNRMADFMKISKNCGSNSEEGCFSSEDYKSLDGSKENLGVSEDSVLLLSDGTAVAFTIYSFDCDSKAGSSDDSPFNQICGDIRVDLDGVKGPNIIGKDTFTFAITKTGIYPAGGQNTIAGKDAEALKSNCFTTGTACESWIIETGNMDYLKATKGVCPNGTELSWENTSCK